MTQVEDPLDKVRNSGARWISIAACVCAVATLAAGLYLPIGSVWPGLFALAFAGMGVSGARLASEFGRQLIGLGVVGLAMSFVSVWGGTGWQIDAHFAFLSFLAVLVVLYDVKVIIVATLAIVLHHLGFGMIFPAYVFPSVDIWENVLRAVFHAVLVVVLDVALIASILTRIRMEAQSAAAYDEALAQAEAAKSARIETEEALAVANEKQAEAEAAERNATKLLDELKRAEAEKAEADAAKEAAALQQEQERAAHLEEQSNVVEALKSGLHRLASRDFSSPIEAHLPYAYRSLRLDYNQALDLLSESLTTLSQQTDDLRGQVATINASASEVSQRSERQVLSLERTAEAMRGLNASVSSSAQNASTTAETAKLVRRGAQAGSETVSKAVEAMREIQDSSEEIAKINALIDGIAFQTNLLALNAGVEAARAGEAGRGFAVVASEVRALSQRTTEAANDIGQLVQRSQVQVQTGASLVGEAGQQLEGIVEEISRMTQAVEDIAATAREQAASVDQVNSAISDLDGVAQSNAAMFEETSAACAYLNDGMDKIRTEIETFTMMRSGTLEKSDDAIRASG